ncbi:MULTISPECIES: GIY-YIG nuclease family protein [Halorhodospira]|uniref:GIY-YIG nuclease family protein n=1 Tax=Halorhodospira TaxID=85108 RepID=UPI001EE7F7CA|nr:MULTISPECIES: GIY-YIG nuclease family protein [Halorhodospira]MCG5529189.1 GIY-YIG nuclease family protein [Halorhodospira halophila]MCG5543120.1 GIY-YIG nuclease family protein [Halorhodospira sp. 9628]
MSYGRSLRLFLVDDSPNGLITAEIMNWTGHVLTGPRSKLSELIQRPECARTGVYFLVGPDPDNSLRPLVYIGETDDVGTRLKQHNRPEDQGGKDFWEKVCLVTSKDQNLTKAHVKHLESLLIQNAIEVGRCRLANGTAKAYANLPEADRADMAFFLDQIRVVLPVLGFDFLRAVPKPSTPEKPGDQPKAEASPFFSLELPKHGLKARGQEYEGEFYVLSGSLARESWKGPSGGYEALFHQLCEDGVLVDDGAGHRRFTQDQAFSSPSAAAAMVSGRTANGRTAWKLEGSCETYAEWQDRQVQAAEEAAASASDQGVSPGDGGP